jgi:hypothetical protein
MGVAATKLKNKANLRKNQKQPSTSLLWTRLPKPILAQVFGCLDTLTFLTSSRLVCSQWSTTKPSWKRVTYRVPDICIADCSAIEHLVFFLDGTLGMPTSFPQSQMKHVAAVTAHDLTPKVVQVLDKLNILPQLTNFKVVCYGERSHAERDLCALLEKMHNLKSFQAYRLKSNLLNKVLACLSSCLSVVDVDITDTSHEPSVGNRETVEHLKRFEKVHLPSTFWSDGSLGDLRLPFAKSIQLNVGQSPKEAIINFLLHVGLGARPVAVKLCGCMPSIEAVATIFAGTETWKRSTVELSLAFATTETIEDGVFRELAPLPCLVGLKVVCQISPSLGKILGDLTYLASSQSLRRLDLYIGNRAHFWRSSKSDSFSLANFLCEIALTSK